MQIVKASDLFEDISRIYNNDFESAENITLDFSDIENIDFKALKTLLSIQKVAIMNNKSIQIKNVKPKINRMLDVTGLNKTFENVASNPVLRK